MFVRELWRTRWAFDGPFVCSLGGAGEGAGGLERPRFHQNSPAEEGKDREDALDWSLFLELQPSDVWAFHFGQRL